MAMTDGSASGWSDGKRYLWLLGALTITLPILAAQLALATGLHVFWWFGPLFAFGVIPVLDTLPEFALVLTRKRRAILLTLVLEDRENLLTQLLFRQRNEHVGRRDAPLLPRAAVVP